MNWLYGQYREPWRSALRASFVLFWVVFSAYFWSDWNGTVIGLILLALIVFQVVAGRLRPSARM